MRVRSWSRSARPGPRSPGAWPWSPRSPRGTWGCGSRGATDGLDWARSWIGWTVLAFVVLYALQPIRRDACAAGALWVQYRRRWVRTYDLNRVSWRSAGGGSWDLTLYDSGGRRLRVPLSALVANPDLWDLVHNGLVHSARRVPGIQPVPVDAHYAPRSGFRVSRPRAGVRRVAEMRAERRARGRR